MKMENKGITKPVNSLSEVCNLSDFEFFLYQLISLKIGDREKLIVPPFV